MVVTVEWELDRRCGMLFRELDDPELCRNGEGRGGGGGGGGSGGGGGGEGMPLNVDLEDENVKNTQEHDGSGARGTHGARTTGPSVDVAAASPSSWSHASSDPVGVSAIPRSRGRVGVRH